MRFTNPEVNADLYIAIDEQAINCVIETIMFQRPSLFNYATQGFIDRQDLLLEAISAHPAVKVPDRKNPLLTQIDQGLPVMWTRLLEESSQPPPASGEQRPALPEFYSLNYFAQITNAQVDFSPGSTISMPADLPKLPMQHFACRLDMTFGVGFPSLSMDLSKHPKAEKLPVLAPIDPASICSFRLGIVLTGKATRTADVEKPLLIAIDGCEVVDLRPAGLECLIESYVKTEISCVIIPQLLTFLRNKLPELIISIDIKTDSDTSIRLPKSVKVTLTSITGSVPYNPSYKNNVMETYIQLVEVVSWDN